MIPMFAIGAFLIVLPAFGGEYYGHIFILIFLNVALATSYRLFYITGLASFCHVTFYELGAYTSALLTTKMGLPIGASILVAGLFPAGLAALVGWPMIRARGVYFFLTSFAFFVAVGTVLKQWQGVTGGTQGIHNIPPIMGFTTVTPYYYIALAFMAVTIFVMYRMDHSRFGAELLAIGDSEALAEVTGININRHRVLAFSIGALFAGFAGSIYAHYIRFVHPNAFTMWFSLYILIWCVMGGPRKFWGPIAGAVLMTSIAEGLRMSGVLQAIFYSIALLITIMTMPNGIAGLVDSLRVRSERRKAGINGTS